MPTKSLHVVWLLCLCIDQIYQYSAGLLQSICLGANTVIRTNIRTENLPDSIVHGANMGPTLVLSAPDGPHVGPMNLVIREIKGTYICSKHIMCVEHLYVTLVGYLFYSYHHHHVGELSQVVHS